MNSNPDHDVACFSNLLPGENECLAAPWTTARDTDVHEMAAGRVGDGMLNNCRRRSRLGSSVNRSEAN